MTSAQATGAGVGAVLGGVLSESLQHYVGYTIDPASATAIVVAMIAGCGVLAHGIDKYGLRGIGVRLWRGSTPPPKTSTSPPVAT